MEKYLLIGTSIGVLLLVIAVSLLAYRLNRLIKKLEHVAELAYDVALAHNELSYSFAKYVFDDLVEKNTRRELTGTEKEYYQAARQTIYKYEQENKKPTVV